MEASTACYFAFALLFDRLFPNLSKQLRTHYPRVIKRHEKVRKRLGLNVM